LAAVTDHLRVRLAAVVDSPRKVLGIVAVPFRASIVAGAALKTSATVAPPAGSARVGAEEARAVGAVVGVVPEVVEVVVAVVPGVVEVGAEAGGDKQVLSIGFQVSGSS
jgi:hypothetical protein